MLHGAVIASWAMDFDDASLDDPVLASWACRDSFWLLMRRIRLFASLPHGTANRRSLQRRVEALQSWQ